MKKRLLKFSILIGLPVVALFIGCKPDVNLNYEAEWILPIIKTKIKAEQISQLENLVLSTDAVPSDVPGLDVTQPIPATPDPGITIGPILVEDEDDYFVQAKADTLQFKIYIKNDFPINIKAGTKVQYKNIIGGEIVCEYTIPRDIAPNSTDSIVPDLITTTTGWIENDLHMYLINFKTDGSNGTLAGWTSESKITVDFKLIVLRINEVHLNASKSYDLRDTSDFTMNDSSIFGLQKAIVNAYINNLLPVTYRTQIYFLDANYNVLDSLFIISEEVKAAKVSTDGYVDPNQEVDEYLWSAEWTPEKTEYLRDNAKYAYFRAYFLTEPAPPAVIKLVHENQIGFQLVGDFVFDVKLTE